MQIILIDFLKAFNLNWIVTREKVNLGNVFEWSEMKMIPFIDFLVALFRSKLNNHE